MENKFPFLWVLSSRKTIANSVCTLYLNLFSLFLSYSAYVCCDECCLICSFNKTNQCSSRVFYSCLPFVAHITSQVTKCRRDGELKYPSLIKQAKWISLCLRVKRWKNSRKNERTESIVNSNCIKREGVLFTHLKERKYGSGTWKEVEIFLSTESQLFEQSQLDKTLT